MPQTPHSERHFTGSETVRDVVIGMSDGLTTPFALAAGLSGAIDSTRIISRPFNIGQQSPPIRRIYSKQLTRQSWEQIRMGLFQD